MFFTILQTHLFFHQGVAASSRGSSRCRCFDSAPVPVPAQSPPTRHAGPVSGGNGSDAQQRAKLKTASKRGRNGVPRGHWG